MEDQEEGEGKKTKKTIGQETATRPGQEQQATSASLSPVVSFNSCPRKLSRQSAEHQILSFSASRRERTHAHDVETGSAEPPQARGENKRGGENKKREAERERGREGSSRAELDRKRRRKRREEENAIRSVYAIFQERTTPAPSLEPLLFLQKFVGPLFLFFSTERKKSHAVIERSSFLLLSAPSLLLLLFLVLSTEPSFSQKGRRRNFFFLFFLSVRPHRPLSSRSLVGWTREKRRKEREQEKKRVCFLLLGEKEQKVGSIKTSFLGHLACPGKPPKSVFSLYLCLL